MDSFFLDLPGRKFLPEAEPFERFFTSFSTVPAVDLVEKENEYSISDEKKDEREEKDKNYSFSERRYGAFKRAFRVPEGVDTDKITARFDQGRADDLAAEEPSRQGGREEDQQNVEVICSAPRKGAGRVDEGPGLDYSGPSSVLVAPPSRSPETFPSRRARATASC
jgi:Hsp20/alpha crystallin family